jgi:hypothetical protein
MVTEESGWRLAVSGWGLVGLIQSLSQAANLPAFPDNLASLLAVLTNRQPLTANR